MASLWHVASSRFRPRKSWRCRAGIAAPSYAPGQYRPSGDAPTCWRRPRASAPGCATTDPGRAVAVRWDGMRLVAADDDNVDGWLLLTRSIRGWLLTASLNAAHLPLGGPICRLAPEVFRLSDRVLGTDFGDLAPPF